MQSQRPAEALASGEPVIRRNEGGVLGTGTCPVGSTSSTLSHFCKLLHYENTDISSNRKCISSRYAYSREYQSIQRRIAQQKNHFSREIRALKSVPVSLLACLLLGVMLTGVTPCIQHCSMRSPKDYRRRHYGN